MKIDLEGARKDNQLHFVGYNFVVSATSSSTKVRMTTDSSMKTETGLCLNEVTQPAPGDIPSLRGILMHSSCHPHYAVYDIKKFFRSVRTSDKDSFLRIVCVLANSFSKPPTPKPTWSFYRDRAIRAQRSPLSRPSFTNPLHYSNLPSFKQSWKTLTLMTEVLGPVPPARSPFYNLKSARF